MNSLEQFVGNQAKNAILKVCADIKKWQAKVWESKKNKKYLWGRKGDLQAFLEKFLVRLSEVKDRNCSDYLFGTYFCSCLVLILTLN